MAIAAIAAAGASARTSATATLSAAQTVSAPNGLVGDSLTLTIAVQNTGPDTANGVVVRDALSGAKGTIQSATPSAGQPCTLGSTSRSLRCVVGTLANGASASVTVVVTLAGPGTLTATATASSRDGADVTAAASADVTETAAPTGLTLSGTAFGAPFTPRPQFTVSWRATDNGGSGIDGYDVRYRAASPATGFGLFFQWQTHTAATHAEFSGRAGTTYCFSFRAADKDANVSPWSPERCAAVLLGASAAKRTGEWKTSTSGTARSRARGAQLTLPAVAARALYVEAERCPGCGSLAVLWQGRVLRTLNLDAKSSGRALVRVAVFPALRRGSLSLRVASAKATVTVAALGIAKR